MDQPQVFILISVASKTTNATSNKASQDNERTEGLFEVMYPAVSYISRLSYAFKAEKW